MKRIEELEQINKDLQEKLDHLKEVLDDTRKERNEFQSIAQKKHEIGCDLKQENSELRQHLHHYQIMARLLEKANK